MSKTTNVDLVKVLEERNVDGRYDSIIERAKNNGYHDFKFDLDPRYADDICPKMALVSDLSKFHELTDVRDDVVNGMYDESPDEEDNIKMNEEFFGIFKEPLK